jgi:hypothetical protein
VVAQGLNQPVFATSPLNDGRAFIVEKGGTLGVAQGGSNDPFANGLYLSTPLGKLLRIDINRDDFASANINYTVPLNNPFVWWTTGAKFCW